MAQRLIRLLCSTCREPDPEPNPQFLRLIDLNAEEQAKGNISKPVGCPKCGNIGFRGRKAIFEMMRMNTEMRDLGQNQAPISVIREAAIRHGMRTLVQDGKIKVLKGETTPDEIARHAQAEDLLVDNVDIDVA